MSEEMKEIVDKLSNRKQETLIQVLRECQLKDIEHPFITKEEYIDKLLNYITSLQQKVEQLEKEIDRLNNIINELDEDIYSLYEDICNSDDTYCYRIPMEIIIDRLDKMSNKITKFNENKLKEVINEYQRTI